jgi:hypothetical protein
MSLPAVTPVRDKGNQKGKIVTLRQQTVSVQTLLGQSSLIDLIARLPDQANENHRRGDVHQSCPTPSTVSGLLHLERNRSTWTW